MKTSDTLGLKDFISKSFHRQEKASATSLKDLFLERINSLNIKRTQAEKLLGIQKRSLDAILNGEGKQLDFINVLKVCEFLKYDLNKMIPDLLSYQGHKKISELSRVNKLSFILENFDIKTLKDTEFIDDKNDVDHILERVLHFFAFESIYEFEEYQKRYENTLFSATRRNFIDKARKFPIISALRYFELINNPNTYSRELLKDLIPKIKPYSRDVENGLHIVCRSLYHHGVTVLIQEKFPCAQFKGATMLVNKKPCIVLTDLDKKYPDLWIALLHELYHVLFDLDEIQKYTYHLSHSGELELINEQQPNDFANDFFFSYEMFRQIKSFIHVPYKVEKFAKERSIHSCFVYRGYQHFVDNVEQKKYWGAFKEFFPKIYNIKNINPLRWNKAGLSDHVENTKKAMKLK